MLSIAANEKNVRINLVFLEKGHTQNINDSVNSVIERVKKGVNIYHPHQWTTLIETACRKNPYKVKLMLQNEMFNFKTDLGGVLEPLIKDKTPGKCGKRNVKVSRLKIKESQFEPSTKENIYMQFKYDLTAEFQRALIGKLPRKTRLRATDLLDVPILYTGKLPIKKALQKVIFSPAALKL